jgi:ethanolamine utilization protein EutA
MTVKPILSVGIDVGTTSTHLTLSRLHLQNVARLAEPSRMVIGDREIIYQSAIHFTPLTSDQQIDARRVLDILKNEYADAGITAGDIATGAIIVTGESARKRNAAQLSEELKELAGNFVVASAGPNLESVLAARGSGAAAASLNTGKTIGNIDIGGGTTNLAVYTAGNLVGAGCLSIGGRFLRLSNQMELLAVSASGSSLCQQVLNVVPDLGSPLSNAVLTSICRYAAEMVADFVCAASAVKLPNLVVSAYRPETEPCVEEWWFSGGVAETMRSDSEQLVPSTRYGDIGPWLGQAIIESFTNRGLRFHIPDQPIRATVIGAGMHSLQLSGSTVSIETSALPIRNMPVIQPFMRGLPAVSDQLTLTRLITNSIAAVLSRQDIDWHQTAIALFIPDLPALGYAGVTAWAQALSNAFTNLKGKAPLVVVCARDVGAALGLAVRKVNPHCPCIILDGISDACGDFIDIGKPIADQQAIPVVLKDLIFTV